MSRLDRVLGEAIRLVVLGRFVRALVVLVMVLAGGLLLVRVVQQMLGSVWVPWLVVWGVGVGLVVAVGWVWAWWGRPDRLGVARLIDERGSLRESLSTAVWIEGVRSGGGVAGEGEAGAGWDEAALRDAERVSGRVSPRALVGVRLPRRWWAGPVLVGLFFVVGVFPEGGLLGASRGEGGAGDGVVEEVLADTDSTLERAREELREVSSGSPEARRALERLDDASLEALRGDPEGYRREAMKRLSEARRALEEAGRDRAAMEAESVRERLMSLRTPGGSGDADFEAMSRALQRGDLLSAREALDRLRGRLEAGELTDEQVAALGRAMEELARRLEEAAGAEDRALSEALRRAGIDPSLAQDAEALRRAIESATGLSAEERERLQQQAAASQAAAQRLSGAAGGLQSGSQALRAGGQEAGNQASQQGGRSGGQQGAPSGDRAGSAGAGQQSAAGALGGLSDQLGGMGSSAARAEAMRSAAARLSGQMRAMSGGGSGLGAGSGSGSGGGSGDLFPAGEPDPLAMTNPRPKHQPPGQRTAGGSAGGGSAGGQGSSGGGAGGGIGSSGGAGLADSAWMENRVGLDSTLASSLYGDGPMVGLEFVDSDGVFVNESLATLSRIVSEAEAESLEASASNSTVFPAEYHGAIRAYFERLNGRVRGGGEAEGDVAEEAASGDGAGSGAGGGAG